MTVKVLFILLGIFLVITLLGAIAFMIKSKKGNAAMKSAGNTLFTCSGCIIIATAILCILCFIGTKHGMYDYNISVPQLITSISNTPEEDTLPDDCTTPASSITGLHAMTARPSTMTCVRLFWVIPTSTGFLPGPRREKL